MRKLLSKNPSKPKEKGVFLMERHCQITGSIQGNSYANTTDGHNIIFWDDMWDGKVLKLSLENISLHEILTWGSLEPALQNPLSVQAFQQ